VLAASSRRSGPGPERRFDEMIAALYESNGITSQDRCQVIERDRTDDQLLARRALEAGVERVVFDRGGYLYHGNIKALADAARENGLEF